MNFHFNALDSFGCGEWTEEENIIKRYSILICRAWAVRSFRGSKVTARMGN